MCRFLVFVAVCFTVVAAYSGSGRPPTHLGDKGGLVDLIKGDLYSKPTLTAWTRQRRQTGSCKRNSEWPCRDGYCIERDAVCDGAVDCPDRSDETQAVCIKRAIGACDLRFYQCTYGACVKEKDKCNDVRNCADGSDEDIKECDTNAARISTHCGKHQFQCRQDRQCIDISDVCDGVANCRDMSDETLYQCATNPCHRRFWKCAYGACVDQDAKCNNVVNCVDGSDEDPVLCAEAAGWRPQVNLTTPSHEFVDPGRRSCTLPNYPEGGKYVYLINPELRPGQIVSEFSPLNYSCDNDYDLSGDPSPYCKNNSWGQTPTCKKKCRMPISFSVDFKCISGNNQEILCGDKPPHGTVVRSICKKEFEMVYSMSEITCDNGNWDAEPPFCKATCGIAKPGAGPLAINAPIAKKNSFPWHVGIYEIDGGKPSYSCGGSILYSNVIISAAHCFDKDNEPTLKPAENFKIAAGKFYRAYDHPKDDSNSWVQKRNVSRIFRPDLYRGDESNFQSDIALVYLSIPLEFGGSVRPICFEIEYTSKSLNDEQIKAGSVGKVAGWGLTESGQPSEELRFLSMPVISNDICIQADEAFPSLLTTDKLCAGHRDGSSLCKGDSGSGLVFPDNRTGKTVWYLRALVSVGPKVEDQCRNDTYTTFTKVFNHIDWMSEILRSLKVLRF